MLYILPSKSIYQYFYIINDDDKFVCFNNKLEIKNNNLTFIDSHYLEKFKTYYMNISHLENIFDVIQNKDNKITYLGINSDFKINQFIIEQIYSTAKLLVDNNFGGLIINELNINQPYFLEVDFYIETEIQRNFSSTQWTALMNDSFAYLCFILLNTPNKKIQSENELETILKVKNNSDAKEFLKVIKQETERLYAKEYKIIEKIIAHSDRTTENPLCFLANYYKVLDYINEIFSFFISYFNFSFLSQNKEVIDLSSGEKTIFFYLDKVINNIFGDKNSILLIDEIELYLHPTWQKKILNILFKILEIKKDEIQILIATHSPFILSDLPKENIIFLDKGKQVKGTEKKQTFGANIHTLLSDSFFMEEGLMGEFAKGKIDKAIKLLNQEYLDEKDLKYCEQIISIIGEPIVKNKLQRMLDSKRLRKIDEIDSIKSSMLEMQKRLDELER